MKRIVSVVLVLVLSCLFVSCGGEDIVPAEEKRSKEPHGVYYLTKEAGLVVNSNRYIEVLGENQCRVFLEVGFVLVEGYYVLLRFQEFPAGSWANMIVSFDYPVYLTDNDGYSSTRIVKNTFYCKYEYATDVILVVSIQYGDTLLNSGAGEYTKKATWWTE